MCYIILFYFIQPCLRDLSSVITVTKQLVVSLESHCTQNLSIESGCSPSFTDLSCLDDSKLSVTVLVHVKLIVYSGCDKDLSMTESCIEQTNDISRQHETREQTRAQKLELKSREYNV